jgi:DNA-binding beta-propeller fold protein YncE
MKTIYLLSKLTLVLHIRHAQAQIVETFAGSGTAGLADGTGTAAAFNQPAGIRMSNSGKLYVADNGNAIIREIDTTARFVSTNRDPKFNGPTGLAFNSSGYLYVADSGDKKIAKFDPNAPKDTLEVLASSSCSGIAFDGILPTNEFPNLLELLLQLLKV